MSINLSKAAYPVKGELANIYISDGVLKVYFGDRLNLDTENIHLIEDCVVSGGEILINATIVSYIQVSDKINEKEGTVTWKGREINQKELVNIAFHGDKILKEKRFKSFWMRITRTPAVITKYVYIDEYICPYRNIKLKQEFWNPVKYLSNVYIINRL